LKSLANCNNESVLSVISIGPQIKVFSHWEEAAKRLSAEPLNNMGLLHLQIREFVIALNSSGKLQ
jgi:hypothetical protein